MKQLKDQSKDTPIIRIQYESRYPETLQFDANFECANIEQVRQRDAKHYDIWMRNDTNSTGELQWFCFRMRNSCKCTVRLTIVNFTKQ
jgi:hypothetical protein